MVVVKYVFALIGFVVLIGSLFWYQRVSAFVARADVAPGKVVELLRSDSDRSAMNRAPDSVAYRPVIQFQTKTGKAIRYVAAAESYPPSYSIGDKVNIVYLEADPRNAKIDGIYSVWGGPLITSSIGLAFLLTGGAIFFFTRPKSTGNSYLRMRGVRIETKYQGVEQDPSLAVDGKCPYRVLAQWENPATSETHLFKSDPLWFDPTGYINRSKVSVFIEKDNPAKYYVDLSFLPKVAGPGQQS